MTDPIREMRDHWDERWGGGLAAEASTQLLRVSQLLLGRLDGILAEFGLTLARYEALTLLTFSRKSELPLSKLGERLMIHPASVTSIVDKLVEFEYVERVPHHSDRRVVLARVTTSGRQIVERASAVIIAANNGFAGLTDDDLETLIALSVRFRDAVGDVGSTDNSVDGSTGVKGGGRRVDQSRVRRARITRSRSA
ncbi:MarR family transcriptional regulator [Pseudonocardia xishanensis]|uniref:MarR family transcriptional regulator n=1 Tax=Pseudonocardia xishanensis TaxID=630995 RepID=A0ABP8RYB1_9PSEU